MDTYIVRIYRRRSSTDFDPRSRQAQELVGTIETPGGQRASFATREELWHALSGEHPASSRTKPRKRAERVKR